MAMFHTNVLDNQIKALPTIKAISNTPIATFDTDIADRLVSCVCEVASGESACNIYACGVNIFDLKGWLTANEVTYTESDDEITFNTSGSLFSNPYVFSSDNVNISFNSVITPVTATNVGFELLDKNGNQLTNRVPYFSNMNGCKMRLNYSSSGSVKVKKPIVNFGATAKPYVAYNGNTYNVQFGETLTDTATYDAISGLLTRNDSTTKQLDSCNIVTLDNEVNNIYNDCGNISLSYQLSVGQAIS